MYGPGQHTAREELGGERVDCGGPPEALSTVWSGLTCIMRVVHVLTKLLNVLSVDIRDGFRILFETPVSIFHLSSCGLRSKIRHMTSSPPLTSTHPYV